MTKHYNKSAHCVTGLEAARVLSTVSAEWSATVHKHKVVF